MEDTEKKDLPEVTDGGTMIFRAGDSSSPKGSETSTTNALDRVMCRECGRYFRAINACHLRTHGMTPAEYKKKYGEAFLYSEKSRQNISHNSKRKSNSKTQYVPRNKDHIIRDIKKLAEGKPLAYSDLKRLDPALLKQAEYIFGDWESITKEAGMEFVGQQSWDATKVIKAIRERRKAGQSLSYSRVRKEYPALVSAAERQFQQWTKAVEEEWNRSQKKRSKKSKA